MISARSKETRQGLSGKVLQVENSLVSISLKQDCKLKINGNCDAFKSNFKPANLVTQGCGVVWFMDELTDGQTDMYVHLDVGRMYGTS